MWWVGAGQFALQVADNQWTCYAPNVGLYTAFPEGAAFWQVTDSNSITQYSTFGLENLGGGNVAITKYPGEYLNGSKQFWESDFQYRHVSRRSETAGSKYDFHHRATPVFTSCWSPAPALA